ncbi:MAG: sigma-70 family RNA polymerase sigma factor [Ginsengibacter sp.]
MKEANTRQVNFLTVSSSQGDLWERFQKGDRDALGKIYRNHVDFLYSYGMHFCLDGERVKDCLQDLFRDLWLEREHLTTSVQNIRYYLLSSLRRRLLRSLQKERRYQSDLPEDSFDFELIPSHESAIVADEIYKEQKAKLQQGIATLTRRQREVIYLRFYQNLSYAEIAGIMVMKIDSVYNLISKAIGLLKNSMVLFFLLLLQ